MHEIEMSMFGRKFKHFSFRNILTKSVRQKSSLLPDLKIIRCLTDGDASCH